jgi:hypothetical protein
LRDPDSRPARFISEDTYEGEVVRPQSLNMYVYVENNSLNFTDPTGHYCVSKDGKNAHPGKCSNTQSSVEVPDKKGQIIVKNGYLVGWAGLGNQHIYEGKRIPVKATLPQIVSTPIKPNNNGYLPEGTVTVDIRKLSQMELTDILMNPNNSSSAQQAAMDEFVRRNFMFIDNGVLKVAEGGKNLLRFVGILGKSSNKVTNTLKVGDKVGNFGVLVGKPNLQWLSSRTHALNRMKEQGLTDLQVKSWIQNGKVIQQDANTYMYVTKEGVAILNKDGVLQTVYSQDKFQDPIKQAITQLFGNK